MELQEPQLLLRGFRVATMDSASPQPYGMLSGHCVGVADGQIIWIEATENLPEFKGDIEVVEGDGRVLTPALVDCHTHLIYGGNRAMEWEKLLSGVSYQEIAKQGGGILSSVNNTRSASEDELLGSALKRLSRLVKEGVTTIEIKSGYGLDLENELKMLRVARRVGEQSGVRVEATLLAAHCVPPEFKNRADDYVALVCNEIIPAATELCSCVDVFCETIAFDVKQSLKVFEVAQQAGLKIKVHAEQLSHTGIAALASEMGALSVDHIEYLTEDDCVVLGNNGTVATVLPGAFYCLQETQKPPIAALLKNEVPIALATDCNPGSSPVTSLLLMGNMGCNLFGLTPEQAFAGITCNAARALDLQDSVGTIKPGIEADFAVWDVESPAEILYGIGYNPCVAVYKNGQRLMV